MSDKRKFLYHEEVLILSIPFLLCGIAINGLTETLLFILPWVIIYLCLWVGIFITGFLEELIKDIKSKK